MIKIDRLLMPADVMSIYIYMKKIILISITVIIAQFIPAHAWAGIVVAPDRHILAVSPGEEKTLMYHISNTGDEGIDITIEAKSWAGLKDPYQWLSLETDEIYLKAGESTPLTVTVSAPDDAEGEMVAMLFLCYKDTGKSQLNIRNGVPLYMIIEGTEYYGLNIEDIEISYGRKGDFYDLNFAVRIKNTGNVHIVPDISIVIKNSNGRTVNTLSLKRPNIVLREKNHIYRLGWREPGLRDGIYKAEVLLDYEDKIGLKAKEIKFQVAGYRVEKIDIVNIGD
jgi:uncharacterized membrane protein